MYGLDYFLLIILFLLLCPCYACSGSFVLLTIISNLTRCDLLNVDRNEHCKAPLTILILERALRVRELPVYRVVWPLLWPQPCIATLTNFLSHFLLLPHSLSSSLSLYRSLVRSLSKRDVADVAPGDKSDSSA